LHVDGILLKLAESQINKELLIDVGILQSDLHVIRASVTKDLVCIRNELMIALLLVYPELNLLTVCVSG